MSNNTKFCADCGEQLNIKAEICPKCGIRQVAKKSKSPLLIILLVVVIGFGSIVFIGILSAIAIPQFSSYKIKGYNSSAISDLRNAKTIVETYLIDNGKLPESLEITGFKNAIGVETIYNKVNKNEYLIISDHKNGTMLYKTTSNDLKIYQRQKNDKKGQFIEL